FFIQFIAGSQGMPRRYADYEGEAWAFGPEAGYFWYHLFSTIGSYVLTVGLFIILFNWIHSLRKGKPAPANPWGANSLEWHTPSPPPHANFEDGDEPEGVDPYDYNGWEYDEETDGYTKKEGYVPEPAH
ncbi:MAG: cytochrome c oxidase subunit I, partial [Planctomycetota bacterium]